MTERDQSDSVAAAIVAGLTNEGAFDADLGTTIARRLIQASRVLDRSRSDVMRHYSHHPKFVERFVSDLYEAESRIWDLVRRLEPSVQEIGWQRWLEDHS